MTINQDICTQTCCIKANMSAQELSSISTSLAEDDDQVVSPAIPEEGEHPPKNGDDNSAETVTMEERKAKLEQLRARMVCFLLIALTTALIAPFLSSGHPRKQTGNHSLRSLQRPRSQFGMLHDSNDKRNWQRCCGHKQKPRLMGRTSNA